MRLAVDIEAEKAVLGSVLLSDRAVLAALEHVQPSDFGHVPHRHVFEAMSALARTNQPIDSIAIAGMLDAQGRLESVGGVVGVASLANSVATAANVEHHAKQVHARARLRRLQEAAASILEQAPVALDADAFFADAQSRLLSLTEDSRGEILSSAQWTKRAWDRYNERLRSGASPSFETGFAELDRMTLFRRGSLVTIAGRPGMGKTASAQNIILGVAKRMHHVFFVSIEMQEDETMDRFIGAKSGVPTRSLEHPVRIDGYGWDCVNHALSELSEQPIDFWEASDVSIDSLRLKARRLHALKPIDLVVVDYLQLMSGSKRAQGREQEVSSISRGLKLLAKELGACVLALSQLNRDCEKRSPPKPQLSDLRDSGSIEQDSSGVIFLFRPWVYDKAHPNPGEVHAIVSKNRHGPLGEIRMQFNLPIQRFTEDPLP